MTNFYVEMLCDRDAPVIGAFFLRKNNEGDDILYSEF